MRALLLLRLGLWACVPAVLAACAAPEPVAPWEKGELARPAMRLEADALSSRFDQHVYTSREGTAGGNGVGGGGCGCN